MSRLNEDTRAFHNLPDIEVSYQSDSGSGSEIDLVDLDEGRSRSQVFSNMNSFVYDGELFKISIFRVLAELVGWIWH